MWVTLSKCFCFFQSLNEVQVPQLQKCYIQCQNGLCRILIQLWLVNLRKMMNPSSLQTCKLEMNKRHSSYHIMFLLIHFKVLFNDKIFPCSAFGYDVWIVWVEESLLLTRLLLLFYTRISLLYVIELRFLYLFWYIHSDKVVCMYTHSRCVFQIFGYFNDGMIWIVYADFSISFPFYLCCLIMSNSVIFLFTFHQ